VDGLRRGRCYVAESSGLSLDLVASHSGGRVAAGIGETLTVTPTTAVTVTATVAGAPGARVGLMTATGCVARMRVDEPGTGRLQWTTTGAGARFVRVEVRRPAVGGVSPMLALTTPSGSKNTMHTTRVHRVHNLR
jgi:hypothetical protein